MQLETPVSIKIDWDNDNHSVVRLIMEGHWSWQEFYCANDQAWTLMDSVSHPVNLIFDLQQGDWIPRGILPERIHLIPVNTHPHYGGTTVYVGDADLTETLDGILSRAYARRCAKPVNYFVASLDHAYDILVRPSA